MATSVEAEMSGESTEATPPHPAVFLATFAVTALAGSAAWALWAAGHRAFAVSAAALGLSLGPCLAGYATAPRSQKPLQRRVVLATGGFAILAYLLGAGGLGLEGLAAALR
jgi:hypothetical protein